MNKATKSLLGGAALLTAGLGAGAVYVNNVVVPEALAERFKAVANDAYASKGPGMGVAANYIDLVTVEPSGFLIYDVKVPGVQVDFKGAQEMDTTIRTPHTTYSMTFDSHQALLNYAFGEDGQEITVRAASVEPVSMDIEMKDELRGATLKASATCASAVYDVIVKGDDYTFVTGQENCDLTFKTDDGIIGIDAEIDVNNFVRKTGNLYDSDTILTASNINVVLGSNDPMAGLHVTVDEISFQAGYDGLASELRTLQAFEPGMVPNGVSFGLNIGKISLDETALQGMAAPEISAAVQLGLDNLKEDEAQAEISLGYTLKNADALTPGVPLHIPEEASCTVTLSDVPVQQAIGSIRNGLTDSVELGFGTIPSITGEGLGVASITDGIGVQFNCAVASPGYDVSYKGNHTVEGTALPGKGQIVVNGFDNLVSNYGMMLGEGGASLGDMFKAMAVPTEDGKGLLWNYELDKTGNLTVNGAPMGPGPVMMP
ncbi:MAG: hypothetical protein H6867_08500 [Rhodospirillales bacterium]|nr:hypothetical protein [Rhodospirillales bacterium]MCB9995593.1 hypothetical protein [Rhodospirillales bacterium]